MKSNRKHRGRKSRSSNGLVRILWPFAAIMMIVIGICIAAWKGFLEGFDEFKRQLWVQGVLPDQVWSAFRKTYFSNVEVKYER